MENLLNDIKAGKFDFDILLTTPEHIRDLAPVAKQLGPKGLMPSPKAGTVVTNIPQAVEEFKKGKIEFKLDKTGNINAAIGKLSFTEDALYKNALCLIDAVMSSNPHGTKGQHVKSLYISTTMGPGLKLDMAEFRK